MDYKDILEKHLKALAQPTKETNEKLCKICNKLKKRIYLGKFDNRNKKWGDEHGKLWSGHYCPECNLERTKNSMKKLRKKDNSNE